MSRAEESVTAAPQPVDHERQTGVSSRERAIGGAAAILMVGNLTGSILGFARQSVIAGVFGDHAATDAFVVASVVPQMFYDLVIGAAVSAALIPTLTDILERRGRDEFWKVVGGLLPLLWAVLAVLVACLILGAEPLMSLVFRFYPGRLQADNIGRAVSITRVLALSLFFLGTSAILTASLYSLRRFVAPAFAPSWYHIGIIVGALLATPVLGIMALPVGAVVGAAAQTLTEVAAVARARPRIRYSLRLTPEIRRILLLYGPVAAGIVISMVGQVFDIAFKLHQGVSAATAMFLATTLTQFPIGIAVAALSFAILPSISSDIAFARLDQYKDTLARGIRFVLFLTIPAAVGYLVLATPIASLLFEHGRYRPHGTAEAATALIGYAFQIPFVGLDQMLIFAFYARKDTKTPMLVGVLGVGIYVLSAYLLAPHLHILGLALANTIQNSAHALILLALLVKSIGWLGDRGIVGSVTKSLAAGLVMAAVAAPLAAAIHAQIDPHVLSGQILQALPPLLAGGAVYLASCAVMRSPELGLAWNVARRRRG